MSWSGRGGRACERVDALERCEMDSRGAAGSTVELPLRSGCCELMDID